MLQVQLETKYIQKSFSKFKKNVYRYGIKESVWTTVKKCFATWKSVNSLLGSQHYIRYAQAMYDSQILGFNINYLNVIWCFLKLQKVGISFSFIQAKEDY